MQPSFWTLLKGITATAVASLFLCSLNWAAPSDPKNPDGHLENSFVGVKFYLNVDFTAAVNKAADLQGGELGKQMRQVAKYPTFLWLDSIAAVNGALAVAAGAFGAHGLKALLSPNMLAVFETSARYHMYHALAMAIAALAGARFAPALFLGGIVLFSGSLYLLALSGITWLGAITPIGGVLFLAGWVCLAAFALRKSFS